MGFPQPEAYLFLQKEIELPESSRDLDYDGGYRCQFKCDVELAEAFDEFGRQLRDKGYRESRRPIINNDRRYTEFVKGSVEIGVNLFSIKGGCRGVLTYEEQ